MDPMELPGPKARAFVKRDSSVISPSYPRGYPLVVDHAKGSEVWDVDGNRFLDFMAGIAVTSTGHAHPKVVKASGRRPSCSYLRLLSPKSELAEKLNGSRRSAGRRHTQPTPAAWRLPSARYHAGRASSQRGAPSTQP
jgi:4-aminobutyrate aminotransferase